MKENTIPKIRSKVGGGSREVGRKGTGRVEGVTASCRSAGMLKE